MSRQGKEVAEAFIDVHGDLSNFRKDLAKADADIEKLARQQAKTFTDEWNKRLESGVGSKWSSIVDAMYSKDPVDFQKLIGEFDTKNLDDASEKINEFLLKMRQHRKLTAEEYKETKAAMAGAIDGLKKYDKAQEDLAKNTQAWTRAHLDMIDALKNARKKQADHESGLLENSERDQTAWLDRRKKTMEEAMEMNRLYARSFDGMVKAVRKADLNKDFTDISNAMARADFSKFAKGFDTFTDLRRRISEVTAAMVEQGRMSRENAAAASGAAHQYILGEEAKLAATRDALDAAKALREEQERYNKSLDGMISHSRMQELETDFRKVADAMASGDWDRISRGSKNIDATAARMHRVAVSMAQDGRITADQYRDINLQLGRMVRNFRTTESAGANTNRMFRNMSDAMTLAGRGVRNVGNGFRRLFTLTKGLRQHLQGFAGLNVFGDMIRSGLDFIHNLDRVALSASKASLMLGSMASIGGSSLAGLVVIAGDVLNSIGGLSALLPAFVTGAGIAIGVAVAAFKDMKTVLADLGPSFNKLQDSISAKFWEQAAQPIRDLTNNLLPTLGAQLAITGTRMGALVGEFASSFQNEASPERVTGMFEKMNAALDRGRAAVSPVVRAFVNLGETGSKYFGRAADAIVGMAEHFDRFIQAAKDDGRLDAWIETGIKGFKDMGRSMDGVFGIFNAIGSAARKAGSGGLSQFADKLQRMAAVMQESGFQRTLTMLFSGFNIAAGTIGRAFADLGPAIASVMPSIKLALVDIGDVVAGIIGYVGQILSNPAVQKGITDFSGSMKEAMEALAPAIKPFGDSLGTILTLLGKVTVSVAEIVTAFVVNLSPVLDKTSVAMETLIVPLRDLAKHVIEVLTPTFQKLADEVIIPMINGIRDDLVPAIKTAVDQMKPLADAIVDTIGPILVTLATETLPAVVAIAGALAPYVETIIKLAAPFVKTAFDELSTGIKGLSTDMGGFTTEAQPFLDRLKAVSDAVSTNKFKLPPELKQGANPWTELAIKWGIEAGKASPKLLVAGKVFDRLTENLQNGWTTVVNFGKNLNTEELKKTIVNAVAGMFANTDVEGFNKTVNKWFDDTIVTPIRNWIEGVPKTFEVFKQMIKTEFQKFMGNLLGFGDSDDDGFGTSGASVGGRGTGIGGKIEKAWGMDDMSFMDRFKAAVGAKWNEFWTGVQTTLTTWGEEIKTGWTTFWDGVGTKVQETWDFVTTWISIKAGEIKTNVETFITDVKTGWTTFWDGVGLKVQETWDFVKTWISTKATEIKTNVDTFITDVKTGWTTFWDGVGLKVQETWDFVVTWIDTKTKEVRTNIDNFIKDVQTNWDTFWRELPTKVKEGWDKIVSEFQTGVDRAVEWVRGLPGKARDAIGDGFNTLINHGRSMMDGFKRGLEERWEGVKNFVGTIAQWIADHKGPISYDRVLLRPAGRAIMEGLGAGLRGELGHLKETLETVTDTMTDTVTSAFAKSKMYLAGAEAALGLADGLNANKMAVDGAFASLLPSGDLSVRAGMVGVGASTPTNTTIINVAAGAIPISTPTENPEIVAAKVIDGFATTISNL